LKAGKRGLAPFLARWPVDSKGEKGARPLFCFNDLKTRGVDDILRWKRGLAPFLLPFQRGSDF